MTERAEAAAAHRALTRTDGDLPTLLRRRDRQPRIWRIRWPRTHPHKDSAAAHFGQTQAPAAAAAPVQEPPRNGHHDWHEAGDRSRRHDAHSAAPDPPTQHARGEAEGTEEDDAERASHDAEQNSQSSATKRPLLPGDTPPRRQAPDERPSPGSAEAQASRVLRTQEPTAEGKRRTVQGDQAAVDALTAELRARSGANTSLSPPGAQRDRLGHQHGHPA